MFEEALTGAVLDAAFAVHTALGPGHLESAYEACLAHELRLRGVGFRRQHAVPVRYRDLSLEVGYRIDLMVEERLVAELKAVERFDPVHTAQILTYLRLTGCRVGLLINFNVSALRRGIRRIVLGAPDP